MYFSEDDFFWGLIVPLILFGVAIGFMLFVGFPWLWEIIKPFIHQLTA